MNYFLVKSEPVKWSWDDQVKAGTTHWDGVRNAQATANLKAMRVGDLAFFYHSNEGKEIVGVVRVSREFYLDPKDETGKLGMVDVAAVERLKTPVTLAQIKADPSFADMTLVRHSRLSVMRVTPEEWRRIAHLGGIA